MMTFEEYQALPGINASAIKAGRVSMKHMRAEMTKEAQSDSPAMRWGRLVHSAILEPDTFFGRVSVFDGVRRGKEWDAFKADHDPAFIIKPDELDGLFALSQSVHADPVAHKLIAGSVHEQTVEWDGGPDIGQCKARMDGWVERTRTLIEIKTTTKIQPAAFGRQFLAYGYDIQCGWYADGAGALCGDKVEHVELIVIEAEYPYDVWTCRVPRLALEVGVKAARGIARRYRACETAGEYPGVLDGSAAIEELPLPEWYGADTISAAFAEMAASEL